MRTNDNGTTLVLDIRTRIVAACDAMVARDIPIIDSEHSALAGVEEDADGIPCAASSGITILGALVVAERLQSYRDSIAVALGVDSGWLVWFAMGPGDATPPPEYLGAYNLGREMRGRYVRP